MNAGVITHWSAVSPYGTDTADFTNGVRSGRPTVGDVDPGTWRAPVAHACLVPRFDLVESLGNKGTKSLDRVTGLALVALRQLDPELWPERTSLVVGTTTGSAHSAMQITRGSLTAARPTHIDPARVPSAIMNFVAGQCAIRAELKGPNTTIAGGRSAALLSLGYGSRLLASGRADVVLCAVAEEYSAERAWIEHRRWGAKILGEGAVVFRLAATAPGAAAQLLGVVNRVWQDSVAGVLRAAVHDLLDRAHVRRSDVEVVSLAGFSPGGEERDVLGELFPGRPLAEQASTLGDSGAASAGFALAAAVATADAGGLALVAAVDPDGPLSVALFQVNGPPPGGNPVRAD